MGTHAVWHVMREHFMCSSRNLNKSNSDPAPYAQYPLTENNTQRQLLYISEGLLNTELKGRGKKGDSARAPHLSSE